MRNIVLVIISSIAAALLGYAFSFTGYINLVWVGAVVFFVSDWVTEAVIFAVLGGLLTDLLLHSNAGVTGLSVLVALSMYLLAKAAGVASKRWQKMIAVVVVFCLCFAVDAVVRSLLGTSVEAGDLIEFWSTGVIVNSLLTLGGILALRQVERTATSGRKVKL